MSFSRVTAVFLAVTGSTFVAFGTMRSSQEAAQTTVVYVVRHAEKTGETSNADLSEKGRERARVLNWMLRDVPLDAIYSTDVPRTMSTVEPVSQARGMSIESYSPRPGHLAGIIRDRYRGKTMLVCGHSNTIPKLLKEFDVGIKEGVLAGYDDLFIVLLTSDAGNTVTSTTLQRLHYPGQR